MGEIGFCACTKCGNYEGDCDFGYQCQEGYTCGSNNCPASLGWDDNTDCCYVPLPGDEYYCSLEVPCSDYEGDCDSDEECKGEGLCGIDNCPDHLGFSSETDCCQPKGI